ncbi:putative alcohol dehydrogenase [Xylariales sp. PMI_506]|nr:putative alcohol dehydrogenase [Xylariales sp. PMI_506]
MSIPVPSVQQAAIIENAGPNGRVVIRDDVPVAEPGPDEILVKLAFTGVCGSELRALFAYSDYTPIAGHEGVGDVVRTGPGVDASLLGQRVGVKWLYSACGECSACVRGFANNCPRQRNTGRHVHGTLQQYVIADARYVTRVEGVPGEVAAPLLCAGLTMIGAVARLDEDATRIAATAAAASDYWVVISGSGGGLGHLGVQLAARVRGYRVIAVDSGAEKRDLSLECGADHFVDFDAEDVSARVHEITGGEGAHAVLVVSGSEDAFRAAPLLVRNMGLIVTIGLPRNDFEIPLSASLCSARALTVTGVAVGTEDQMRELLRLAAAGAIRPSITMMDFSDIPSIFEKLRTGAVTGRVVVRIP